MACKTCNCSNTKCGCKDAPLTTAPVFTCPPDVKCPDPTPCYETIQDTCVKHSSQYSIYQFGRLFQNGGSYPVLPAGASLENAYQAMSIQDINDFDLCLPPINVHPSYIGTSTIIISWEDTGADTYTFEYAIDPIVAWTSVNGLITTSYTLSLLSPDTNYYFKVTTNCNATETNSTSAVIIVRTLPGL
jgi:hypothetical protein